MRPWTEMRSLDIADRLTRVARGEIPSTYIVFVHLLCVNAQNWFQLYEENLKFFFSFILIGWRLQGLHCYRFFEVQHSWERAADLCKRWVPIYLFRNLFLYFYFCQLEYYCVLLSRHPPTLNPSRCTLKNFKAPIFHANLCRKRCCREGLSPSSFFLFFWITSERHLSFVILSP
jgi:hypothetical protein